MKILDVSVVGRQAAERAMRRDALHDNPEAEAVVSAIIARVRSEGDAALLDLGRRFDCPEMSSLKVTQEEWDAGTASVPAAHRDALELCAGNVRDFHERHRRESWIHADGDRLVGQMLRPLDAVGVYVPGGTAAYPSTVLMCVIPAKVAGVRRVTVATPCGRSGKLHPLVLLAARIAGADEILLAGGAQAVAALAYGTETAPRVDKIVGPGNVYVNLAKRQLWGRVDMDMLAGPSEVCVLADESANPEFVAADLLVQAEHDADAAAYLITPSPALAQRVQRSVKRQLADLPRRAILEQALAAHGAILVTKDLAEAVDLANACAPEHLALMVEDPLAWLPRVRNAGAILMGPHTPQTVGDYGAGPSHTLPTSGTARFASPLNVDTFVKKTSVIQYSPAALAAIAPALTALAEAEGFGAHAEAVRVRLRAQSAD
ncbi:MAG: histidinol dehydrogenase [Armatimonadetes bacterium]|nr:histidinol dehydrogenase [Armatimonadota bacterium]